MYCTGHACSVVMARPTAAERKTSDFKVLLFSRAYFAGLWYSFKTLMVPHHTAQEEYKIAHIFEGLAAQE